METLVAQEIISQYYGKPVTRAFVALEKEALALGHATGTLDTGQEWLYVALLSAAARITMTDEELRDDLGHTAADQTNLSSRIDAARARSAAALVAHHLGKVLPPLAQHGLVDMKASLAVLALGLDDQGNRGQCDLPRHARTD
jgi:hypothetical protein